jgi:hypothetical protein
VLAARPEQFEEPVCQRLGLAPEVYWNTTPADLCVMLRAERRRTNVEIRRLAMAVSYITAPHVDKTHRSAVSAKNLVFSFADYDPDPEDDQ